MLNEIKLKLLGLFWETELEVESVNEGIQRTLCKGDEEEVERKKQEESNMDLHRFFYSSKKQIDDVQLYEDETRKGYIDDLEKLSQHKRNEAVEGLGAKNKEQYAKKLFLDKHRYANTPGG